MADPIAAFNFEVILAPSGQGGDEGVTRTAAFSEVSGLELTMEPVVLREGGYNYGVRQLLGKVSSPALVLKRGLTTDRAFWDWVERCTRGGYPLPYVSGEILVYAPDRSTVARWAFHNGICTKVRSADLNASSASAVALEELHIAHEGLTRESP